MRTDTEMTWCCCCRACFYNDPQTCRIQNCRTCNQQPIRIYCVNQSETSVYLHTDIGDGGRKTWIEMSEKYINTNTDHRSGETSHEVKINK